MPTPNPMKALYAKLATFGLPRAWVRQNLLPSWWDDEAALTDAGFSEASTSLATPASESPRSTRLQSPAEAAPASVRFKRRSDAEMGGLGNRAHPLDPARTNRCGCRGGPGPESTSGPSSSASNCSRPEAAMNLEALLTYCWSGIGIPVLRATNFPPARENLMRSRSTSEAGG